MNWPYWPLYIHFRLGDCDWYAHGWRAGLVDLSVLVLMGLTVRLVYRAIRFFATGGVDS